MSEKQGGRHFENALLMWCTIVVPVFGAWMRPKSLTIQMRCCFSCCTTFEFAVPFLKLNVLNNYFHVTLVIFKKLQAPIFF